MTSASLGSPPGFLLSDGGCVAAHLSSPPTDDAGTQAWQATGGVNADTQPSLWSPRIGLRGLRNSIRERRRDTLVCMNCYLGLFSEWGLLAVLGPWCWEDRPLSAVASGSQPAHPGYLTVTSHWEANRHLAELLLCRYGKGVGGGERNG